MPRIRLAEDDESMRVYIGRALERAGYTVTSVDRGTAALPLVATGGFDLLLTDIVMPEMDGIELAQRAVALAPAMFVMFITGFAASAQNGIAPCRGRECHQLDNLVLVVSLKRILRRFTIANSLHLLDESNTHNPG